MCLFRFSGLLLSVATMSDLVKSLVIWLLEANQPHTRFLLTTFCWTLGQGIWLSEWLSKNMDNKFAPCGTSFDQQKTGDKDKIPLFPHIVPRHYFFMLSVWSCPIWSSGCTCQEMGCSLLKAFHEAVLPSNASLCITAHSFLTSPSLSWPWDNTF